MSYIHHIFDFIIFPFYAQYFQRFIYIFSKTYNSHLVILYISHNSFSKKGNEISPTPFVISYLFTIPLHLHPLIPPRHWLSLFLCNLTAVFIQYFCHTESRSLVAPFCFSCSLIFFKNTGRCLYLPVLKMKHWLFLYERDYRTGLYRVTKCCKACNFVIFKIDRFIG